MPLVILETSNWVDVAEFTGMSLTQDMVLRNYGSQSVLVKVSPTVPTIQDGYPVMSGEVVSVRNAGVKVWIKGSTGVKVWVEDQDSNPVSQYNMVGLQSDLITGSGEDVLGTKRIRVDQGQTSFWQGKQFRTFQELDIPAGASHTIRITVGVNTILKSLSLNILTGDAKLSIIGSGVSGGTYSTILPVIRKNSMTTTPVVPSQNTIASGGSVTGGTLLDIVRIVAAEGQGNRKEASVGGVQDDERAVGPGVFFYKIEAVGSIPVTGVINLFWEER